MKVFISADIEGVTGAAHWDETDREKADYGEFREQMTAEVAAACEGALEAGAAEIWVKDAHASARNIIAGRLPPQARLLRGWSGHPFLMLDGLDETFQAAMMIGYHSPGGTGTNPLAHTITGRVASITINGRLTSEFWIGACTAALVKVPVVLLSGDAGLCREAAETIPALTSVAVKEGTGGLTNNIQPQLALEKIRQAARLALSGDLDRCQLALAENFAVEICYKDAFRAYSSSFYPGASLLNPTTLYFKTDRFFEVLRLFSFVL